MRKIITGLMFFFALLLTFVCFAEQRLTQPVADMLRAHKFAIRYIYTTDNEHVKGGEDTIKKINDIRNEITLVMDGQNALTSTDHYKFDKLEQSFGFLYLNGESYALMADFGKAPAVTNTFELNTKKMKYITKYMGDNSNQGKIAVESSYRFLIYCFMPLLPELNTVKLENGKEGPVNPCTVFSKIGEEVIGGRTLQYEEYKTPENSKMTMMARYYFQDGKLVQYLQIHDAFEADKAWKEAYGTDKENPGGFVKLDVLELTDTFDDKCLQVPKGVKIYKFKAPF